MEGKKVLIIDDDPGLRQVVKEALEVEGATVFEAGDGRTGLQQFYSHRPDLVLLDVIMPDMNGWETCRQLRMLDDTPIIMMTGLKEDEEVIRGLDYGADDFVIKPFSASVLMARARAALRRAEPREGEQPVVYRDERLLIDLDRRRVKVNGEPVKLTATEFRLLACLMRRPGRVVTYENILEEVWGWEYRDSVDYVHVYVSHLRRKLEEESRNPRYFLTEHGVGYRFKGDLEI